MLVKNQPTAGEGLIILVEDGSARESAGPGFLTPNGRAAHPDAANPRLLRAAGVRVFGDGARVRSRSHGSQQSCLRVGV